MVVLNKIYTKTGDDGTTALGTGERRPKYDLRIETYGTVDETNAAIGMARRRARRRIFAELDAMLARIQNDLFDLGAELATPDDGTPKDFEPLRIVASQAERIEHDIDRLNVRTEAAPLLRAAGRQPRRGGAACRAHRVAPRRAADGGARRAGAGTRRPAGARST